jgi:anti-sigma regulatory factor (Ser/Thr protein kinase)
VDTVRAELASTPKEVRVARSLVARALSPWPHLHDPAALLVTELATNAVLHARSTFLVEVAVGARTVRIAVSDTSPVLPHRKRHGVEAGTGRGTRPGRAAVDRLGCERHEHGPYRKTVWCELPLDPAALPGPEDGALLATA